MRQRAKDNAPRWAALVVIAVVALGAYALSPAIGGPARLTTKQAKRLFYTKTESNTRFYTKDVANARFLPRQTGDYSVSLDPWDWGPLDGGDSKEVGFVAINEGGPSSQAFDLHEGNLPTEIASKGLRLSSIEVCFELDNATFSGLRVTRSGPVGGDPVPATPITFLDDQTDTTENTCKLFSAPPAPVNGAATLDLELTVDFGAGPAGIDIGRTNAIFVP